MRFADFLGDIRLSHILPNCSDLIARDAAKKMMNDILTDDED